MKKIYAIIVTYNGAPWIRGALDSLRESEMPITALVVDNASTDDSAGIVRREYPEAILIELQRNTGFGVGNNTGIKRALADQADYVFLLNQDAYVTPQALGSLVDFLEQQPDFAIVSPLHCSPDLGTIDYLTQVGYFHRYARDYLSDACLGQVRPHYEIRGVNAAAWLVRSEAFRQVGGFDPLFFMYGEDNDLLTRFFYHRQRFALLPASRVVHLRARSPHLQVALPRRLWRASEKPRSELLVDLKHPAGRLSGKLLRLAASGLVLPLARFLSDRNIPDLFSYYLATLRLLLETPAILRHTSLCRRQGCHFIE
jgi:GT2 family glycosyltransferase